MDVLEYERMVDKFELIRDAEIGARQLEDGLGIPHEKVRERLKKRRLTLGDIES